MSEDQKLPTLDFSKIPDGIAGAALIAAAHIAVNPNVKRQHKSLLKEVVMNAEGILQHARERKWFRS